MFKLAVLLLSVVVLTQSATVFVNDNTMDVARWAAKQLPTYYPGDYTIMTVRNAQVNRDTTGVNYKFTLDVVVGTEDFKYTVSFI